MSDDHEGRDGCLERTSFPLFHPKKSKMLSRSSGIERNKKMDRYGTANTDIIEDNGYREENVSHKEEMTNIRGQGEDPDRLLGLDAASSSSVNNINPYLMNPLLAMGLPQLAMFMQQNQQHQHILQSNSNQSAPSLLNPLLMSSMLSPGQVGGISSVSSPEQATPKSWAARNIPSYQQSNVKTIGTVASSAALVNSSIAATPLRPMVQVPRENQSAVIQKEESVSTSTSKHPFVCELCRQWFFAKEKLIMHLVTNHSMHYCRFCSELFSSPEDRDAHIEKIHLPLQCDMCESCLSNSQTLSNHYLTVHDVQSCLFCGVLVRPKSYYGVHVRKKHFLLTEDALDEVLHDANNVHIIRTWDSEESGSVWNFTCNLCGKERKRTETFGHFFSYHRLSLPCLIQLLSSENITVSVHGTPAPASSLIPNTSDEIPLPISDASQNSGNSLVNSTENLFTTLTCRVCTNPFSQQVPKPAHDLFCRGLNLCRVCDRTFSTKTARNNHALKEHGKLPCRIGCPPNIVSFTQEKDLIVHYWQDHNVTVCLYCKILLSDRSLVVEHLTKEHLCSQDCSALEDCGPKFGAEMFQCKTSNSSFHVQCSLCNIDITPIMKDIVLLFKHLFYHKISLQAALELLERNLLIDNDCPCNDSDEKTTTESTLHEECVTHIESSNTKISLQSLEAVLPSASDLSEQTENIKNLSKKQIVPNSNDNSSKEIISSSKPGDIEFVTTKGAHSRSIQKEILKEGQIPTKVGKSPKVRVGKLEDKNGERSRFSKPSEETNFDSSSDDPTSDEDFGVSEAEAAENEYTEEDDESMALEEQKLKTNVLNLESEELEAEFDPHDIECVYTDTSDDECEDISKFFTSMNLSIKQEQLDEEIDQKSLPTIAEKVHGVDVLEQTVKEMFGGAGLNTNRTQTIVHVKNEPVADFNVGIVEMLCEICQGRFLMEEGPRELARHMSTSHGFSVSTYGVREYRCSADCGESFGSEIMLQKHRADVHDEPPPRHPLQHSDYSCQFCALRSISKPAMRQHLSSAHSEECDKLSPFGDMAYPCRHCTEKFWKVEDRNDHQVLKHEDQIENFYKCYVCQRVYSSKLCLNRHLKLDHTSQMKYSSLAYKCKLCLMLLPAIAMLRPHFQDSHPTSLVFHCHRCNTTLKTKKTLKCHIKNVHSEERRRDCGLCGKVLWSKRAYAIHFRMKHSAQSKVGFRCRICQQRFDSKDERKLHYQVDHEGESPYHCAECGKGFASKSGMYGHRQLHTGSGISKCEYCGKEFTRKDSYNEHLLIHNGPRHKCPHCPKEFVQRSNLVRHIRIHTGEKPYKCLYCEKCFSDKGACNSHIRVHTREETCSCPYCGQTFSKKQKLKYHIRKHTGEGLMTCEICSKTFTNSFALKEHRVIHNRQTQILCQQCGKGFNSEKYLQRHVAIVHEPSKLYACPLCPKIFSQHGRLKAHLMTHTGVKHMKCLLCDKAYSVRKSLRRHLLEKHQVSPEHPQYKNCFYAMTAAEAGLLIPEGAGPFVPPDDDSTSQSRDDDEYRKKKQPTRKFPRKPPGRKGPSKRGNVSKTSAPFEVYSALEGGDEIEDGSDIKKTRRKYNSKKKVKENESAADGDICSMLETDAPSPSTSSGITLKKLRQRPHSNLDFVPSDSSTSAAESSPPSSYPVKRKVGRPAKRQVSYVQSQRKVQSLGRKKRRVEAIVEILQKTSSSPSSASPREDDDEDPLKVEVKSKLGLDQDSESGEEPVLAKILPLNCPKKQRKGSVESQPGVSGERTKDHSVETSKTTEQSDDDSS